MENAASGIWRIRFGKPEKFTPITVTNQGKVSDAINTLPCSNIPPVLPDNITFKVMQRGCVIELPMSSAEEFYGTGLQLKSLGQKHKKKYLRVNADPIADTGDTHAPVPFFVSTLGYGVLVDTARYVSFYFGSSQRFDKGKVEAKTENYVAANNTTDLYTVHHENENSVVTIEIPHVQGVDIYLFEGPDIKTAVQRYNLFSGGGCIPPFWGLGNYYRAYASADDNTVFSLAEGLRNANMPCDVLGMEPGWQSHAYSCTYAWHKTNFGDSNKFINNIRHMNFKINLWEHIFVHPDSPIYNDLAPYAGDYQVWKGLVPDLYIKEARQIFAGYHEKELAKKGIAGFKLDECDSSDYTGAWSFPDCSEFPSGLDGEQMHSLLGLLYQDTLFEVFRNNNIRTYGQVRASHAFAARMPYVLYSDLYDMKDYIRGLVNSGFSGILWSPEVRQCESVEDLIRRIQLVVLSAQSCINAWMIPNPPWLQFDYDKNLKGELLENYKEVQDICRKFLELRMSLIPYLYSSFARYCFEGVPPFRALVMDYPDDRNTYELDDQFMIGDAMMAAPVVAGQKGRNVYLPEGIWYCYWSNKSYEGGQTYSFDVNLNEIPLFVKSGTLLPLAEPVQYITEQTCFEIVARGYGKNCSCLLFEDDGNSFDFKKGIYNYVKLSIRSDGSCEVERSGKYEGKKYNLAKVEIIL